MTEQMWPRLIDGGFFSWAYGTRDYNFGNWDISRLKYQDCLICMDGSKNYRYTISSGYKARRAKKRDDDPVQKALREKVKRFQTLLRIDPLVHYLEIDSCEADDLVSLLWMRGHGRLGVIGEDKDLFQVPGLASKMVNIQGEAAHPHMKLPQYAQYPTTPEEHIWIQCLFGDRSDSVPRLLPTYGAKTIYQQLTSDPSPIARWKKSCHIYGKSLLLNLKLLLIPGIWLRPDAERYLTPSVWDKDSIHLLKLVISGRYWEEQSFLSFTQLGVDLPCPVLTNKSVSTSGDLEAHLLSELSRKYEVSSATRTSLPPIEAVSSSFQEVPLD